MKENTGRINRRDFLKGAALSTAALSIAGFSVGCASKSAGRSTKTQGEITSWDNEVDVLVVGTGTASIAALASANYGAKSVMIVDKMDAFGGTSALSAGACYLPLISSNAAEGITDSREDVLKYMKGVGLGRQDDELLEAYVDSAAPYTEWTKEAFGFSDWRHMED